MKQPAVYIMANRRNGTLHTGVTSDPPRRVHEHKAGTIPGFTKRYGCTLLVYVEVFDEMVAAIAREKQIKAGSRRKMLAMIEEMNPIGWTCRRRSRRRFAVGRHEDWIATLRSQ